jgi:hypothetical protein
MECTVGDGDRNAFHFGLEAEYLLVDALSFQPLWHPDLDFETLNSALEAIPAGDFSCAGFKTEPPHRRAMPFVVEGYHMPDPDMNPIDLLPKGVEIRTPIAASIEECLTAMKTLYDRMQSALGGLGYRAAALSFHPIETDFEGPQNKRRHDYWQWAMRAMLTYGPDVNVSVPKRVADGLDLKDLHRKVNYYAPALTALTLASPLTMGRPWMIRGRIGKSVRTYHRSATAPAIEVHPKEGLRLEFKPFEMSCALIDYRNYFLLWLALILDAGLQGRASDQTRVYDLGRIAWEGAASGMVRERAGEVLERAPKALAPWGFDCDSLELFRTRLTTGILPADSILSSFERLQSLPGVLRELSSLN